jgi:hypothetical protein
MKNKPVLWVNLALFALILLLAFGPALATFAAGGIANAAGCELNEGQVNPCVIAGADWGEFLYSLGMMFWFTFFTVPAALALAAFAIVGNLVWFIARKLRKKDS